jgi:hypothetical protein
MENSPSLESHDFSLLDNSSTNEIRKIKCKNDNHKSSVVAICLNRGECKKSPLACCKCLLQFHSKCEHNLLFLEDLVENNLESILSIQKFREFTYFVKELEHFRLTDENFSNLEKINSELENETFYNEINNKINSFLDIIITKINDLKESLNLTVSESLRSFQEFNINKEKILLNSMKLNELKKLLELVSNDPSSEDKITNFIDNYELYINSEVAEFSKKLNIYQQHFKKGSLMKKLDQNFSELKTFMDQKFSISSLLDSYKSFTFSNERKAKSIELSENKTKATKVSEIGYHGLCADMILNSNSGIVKWQFLLLGLEACREHSENQWVNFGIVEEKYANSNEIFPYDKSYGYSTFNQNYKMTSVAGKLENPLNNTKIYCIFDPTRKTFEMYDEKRRFIAENIDLDMSVNYFPFAILYGVGNAIQLKFQ